MSDVRGFEAEEVILIGLVNVDRCDSCQHIIHFNGPRPKTCPRCGQDTRPNREDAHER